MSDKLTAAFEYYRAHQDELVAEYDGKVVVIKDNEVLAVYESELEAFEETKKEHEPGTFLVQTVRPGTDSYTQTFHSRVRFA